MSRSWNLPSDGRIGRGPIHSLVVKLVVFLTKNQSLRVSSLLKDSPIATSTIYSSDHSQYLLVLGRASPQFLGCSTYHLPPSRVLSLVRISRAHSLLVRI